MSTASKRTVLVTGASKNSIGEALVLEFLNQGLHVIATAQTFEKIQHLESLGVEIYELDVTSSSSIEALRAKIVRLDILFNNVGINIVGMLADIPMPTFRKQFEVNVFGIVELTQALLPLLIASKGIIVNHTSQAAYAIMTMTGPYSASKAALATYTDVLRIELKPFDVRVMELVTGGALSNITLDMKPPLIPENSLYAPIQAEMRAVANPEKVRKMVMPREKFAKKVVGDVLRSRGPAAWCWRGSLASTMWVVWILKCLWKGIFDGIFGRICGLHLLKARIEQEQLRKTS